VPWLVSPGELTPEQIRVVELPANENRLVSGFPGSGKTQILMHRAAMLRESLNSPPERYQIFLYTNVLRDYVRSGLTYLGIPEDSALTIDHWCRLTWQEAFPGKRLPYKDRGPDFEQIREEVLGVLRTQSAFQKRLDFALVDEGQDLTPTQYQILALAAQHVTVFADFLQSMFDDGSTEAAMREELGIRQKNLTLLGAYRNSQDVARLAGLFLSNEEKREEYYRSAKPNAIEREQPVLLLAGSPIDEIDELAKEVKRRLVLNQTVGILLPTKRLVFGLSKGLAERGVTVEEAVPQRKNSIPPNYDNSVPKIATYHSAKGLTFDVVLMPRLMNNAFGQFSEADRRKMLYVGTARARQWVYYSAYGENLLPEVDLLLKESHGRNLLHVIRKEKQAFAEAEVPEEEEQVSLF
jgi:superfamily I DNA/RNA helicase